MANEAACVIWLAPLHELLFRSLGPNPWVGGGLVVVVVVFMSLSLARLFVVSCVWGVVLRGFFLPLPFLYIFSLMKWYRILSCVQERNVTCDHYYDVHNKLKFFRYESSEIKFVWYNLQILRLSANQRLTSLYLRLCANLTKWKWGSLWLPCVTFFWNCFHV